MRRSLLSYLEDINLAIADIEEFAGGKSFSDYETDRLLQSAVERKFIIIGEALAQMEHHFPGERQRIANVRHIVSFRNLLVHQYAAMNLGEVFAALGVPMLVLKVQVRQWIAELDPSRPTYSE